MDKLNGEQQFERMIGDVDINCEPPAGHRQELKRQVLAAFAESAEAQPARRSTWRVRLKGAFLMRNTRARVIAAAGIVSIGLVALGLWAIFQQGTKLAFADVRKQVLAAHSVRFKMTGKVETPSLPQKGTQSFTAEVTLLESGVLRQTMQAGGQEMNQVVNWPQRKMLTLVPADRQAVMIEMTNVPAESTQANLFEQFRNCPDKADTVAGEKEVDGRKLQGFRVSQGQNMQSTVWVDPQTRLPVEVEITMGGGMLPKSTIVMTDFGWDVEVDESLMSLDVPAGYELSTMAMNMAPPIEQDIIDSLRMLADLNGGVFPDSFDMVGLMKALRSSMGGKLPKDDKSPEGKAFKAKMMEVMPKIGRGFMFAADPKNGSDWHYAGMKAKQGDAAAPIFWYLPKDSESYHVIYADLSVDDVAPDDLPDVPSIDLAKPPAAPATRPEALPADGQ